MKKIMKRLLTPFAIFALALGLGVTLHNKEVVGTRAAETLLNSFNFLDGGDSSNSAYAKVNLVTNVSYAADNPGGTSGTTEWEADYANLSGTAWTRLGGKLVSTVQTDDTTAWANIKTKFTFAPVISKVELVGAGTFGTAENLTQIYLQSSTDSITWTTIAQTGTKSGLITFSGFTTTANSYLRLGIDLTASGSNSGLSFTGLKVYEAPDPNAPGVVIDTLDQQLEVGQTYTYAATINNAPAAVVTWSIDDTAVATINSSTGLVTAVGPGSAIITATITHETVDYTDTANVTVLFTEPAPINETLANIIAIPLNDPINKTVTYTTTAIIKGFGSTGTGAADQYGNMVVMTADGASVIVVYGATATGTALTYNRLTGLYAYSNPRDFLTNAMTKDLKPGFEINIIAIRADYQTTKQLNIIITGSTNLPYNHALVLANDVMTGEGLNAFENCEAVYTSLKAKYDALSSYAKAEFDTNAEEVFVNARARMAFLKAYVDALTPATPVGSGTTKTNTIATTLVIGVIGLSFILGFAYLEKKRKNN